MLGAPSAVSRKGAVPPAALHNFTPSGPDVATRVPSGLNARPLTALVWRATVNSAPSATVQSFAVPSPLFVARRVPSGLKATIQTL